MELIFYYMERQTNDGEISVSVLIVSFFGLHYQLLKKKVSGKPKQMWGPRAVVLLTIDTLITREQLAGFISLQFQ